MTRVGRRPGAAVVARAEARVDDQPQVRLGGEDRPARPASNAGATTTSRKIDVSASASRRVDRAGERDDAAERRDRVAGERGLPAPRGAWPRSAAPHGLVCLTMTQAGPRRSRASAAAAEASRMLLYESGLALERRRAGRERAVRRVASRAAGTAPRAGAGSRRSGASRPSRARSSGWPGTDRSAGQPGSSGSATPAVAIRPGRLVRDPRVVGGGVPERLDARAPSAGPAPTAPVSSERREHGARTAPATSRSPRWRGSWPPPGPCVGPADVDLLDQLVERDARVARRPPRTGRG